MTHLAVPKITKTGSFKISVLQKEQPQRRNSIEAHRLSLQPALLL
jgi:hypothetical protein